MEPISKHDPPELRKTLLVSASLVIMNETSKQWTWSDGWILMSIYLVQNTESQRLSDVIRAADATNHAIPTCEELSQAFTKLTNAGVVQIEKEIYRINSIYLRDIEKAYKSEGGLFQSGHKGQRWLQRSNLQIVAKPSIRVTRKKVDEAYHIYISEIKSID